MAKVGNIRRMGAAALDLAMVACGRLDGYWERGINSWDVAAGIVLVREAGGFVTDFAGGGDMLTKGEVCVGNETIHRLLLDVLRKA
jgi:myo-inositol-1(or 4)-monophosphatase